MTTQLEKTYFEVNHPTHVFLTGATGILGAHLLKQLLLTTETKVYCLIRAESKPHAIERLKALFRVYDPDSELEEEFRTRVIPVLGDVSIENFGISEKKYSELVANVDVTLHVAAVTNLFLNYRRVRPTNIDGTKNIIQFVLKTRARYLCHVSTHTVMGDKTFDATVTFKETDLDIGQGFEHMTYQHTKFLGEKLVREAKESGLRWNIMRPGQIFGESTTGRYPLRESNVTGLFYDILKTIIESKLAMVSPSYFDIVPVDYVSRAILALGLTPKHFFETYHLVNPDMKTYSEVIALVKRLGYDINVISQEEYKKRLLANKITTPDGIEYKSRTTSAFKWWFKRGIKFEGSALTDCTYTTQKLAKLGIECPEVNEKLLQTYLQAAARENYFSATHKTHLKPSLKAAEPAWNEASL